MWDILLNSLWGWIGITGVIVIVCALVIWLIPSLRWTAIVTAVGAIFFTAARAMGYRERAEIEKRRKEEAVRRNQAEYDRINKRPDTPTDVEKRLNDGTF